MPTDLMPALAAAPPGDAARICPLDGYTVESQVGFLLRRAHQRQTAVWQACMAEGIGEKELTPVSYTHLTLPTICSV